MSGHPGKVLDFKKDIILLLLNVPLLDILHIYSHTHACVHTHSCLELCFKKMSS